MTAGSSVIKVHMSADLRLFRATINPTSVWPSTTTSHLLPVLFPSSTTTPAIGRSVNVPNLKTGWHLSTPAGFNGLG